jgi:hypothetical protein
LISPGGKQPEFPAQNAWSPVFLSLARISCHPWTERSMGASVFWSFRTERHKTLNLALNIPRLRIMLMARGYLLYRWGRNRRNINCHETPTDRFGRGAERGQDVTKTVRRNLSRAKR